MDSHGRHHKHPNDPVLDPNTNVSVLVLTPSQVETRDFALRRFQAFYYLPLVMLEVIDMHKHSVGNLLSGSARYPVAEAAGMLLYIAVYPLVLLHFLDLPQFLAFITVLVLGRGLYIGLIFAPNHKGMPLRAGIDGNRVMTEQITTTRNVRPGRWTDFMLGGLNYQIEHHLFPGIPRNKLNAAREVIKPFCEANGWEYAEESLLGSYASVFRYLNEEVWAQGGNSPQDFASTRLDGGDLPAPSAPGL
jgi:fatty acid desaturase